MNTQNPNPAELSTAALLRAAADGELSAADQARLNAHLESHPQDHSRIAFEKGLRSCCCRGMTGPEYACPKALRDRVTAQVAGEIAGETAAETADQPAVISPAAARSTSFWATPRSKQVFGAIAAALVLFVGAAFVINLTRYSTNVPTQGEFAQVVSFVASEHKECDFNPDRTRKFTILSIEDAPKALAGIIGSEPTIPDLEAAGLVFKGAGRCGVPEGGKSAHLRFEMPDPDGGQPQRLSLFVQHVEANTPELDENVAYLITPKEGAPHGMVVYAWRKSDVVYYLVANKLSACNKFRDAVGIPKTVAAR